MSQFRWLIREPLVHFLLIAGAVFIVYTLMFEPETAAVEPDQVTIGPEQVEQVAARFRATWRRPPTRVELDGLIDGIVREEILVREAQALSMDVGDTIIRNRLTQKMTFLIESAAGARQPTEAELRAHFEANAEAYAEDARIGFEQIFLGERPDAAQIEAIRVALAEGQAPGDLGQRTLLPPGMSASVQTAIDGTFGSGFFAALETLAPGAWAGPVRSGFGVHFVRVAEIRRGGLPAFETVRDRVVADWRTEMTQEMVESVYGELRDRYTVTRPTEVEIESVLQ
jgi:hypothetical protein